jgi:hypothetical protein
MTEECIDIRWYRSPWGIVILVVWAVAFGANLALGQAPFRTVTTGLLLFSHLTLVLIGLHRDKKARDTPVPH